MNIFKKDRPSVHQASPIITAILGESRCSLEGQRKPGSIRDPSLTHLQNAWLACDVGLPWKQPFITEEDGGAPLHLMSSHPSLTAPHTGHCVTSIGNTFPVPSVSRPSISRPESREKNYFQPQVSQDLHGN